MSRSFKKTPIVKDNRRGRKKSKRLANRKIRNTAALSNGKFYRKVFCSYDIYRTLRQNDDKYNNEDIELMWKRFYYWK